LLHPLGDPQRPDLSTDVNIDWFRHGLLRGLNKAIDRRLVIAEFTTFL